MICHLQQAQTSPALHNDRAPSQPHNLPLGISCGYKTVQNLNQGLDDVSIALAHTQLQHHHITPVKTDLVLWGEGNPLLPEMLDEPMGKSKTICAHSPNTALRAQALPSLLQHVTSNMHKSGFGRTNHTTGNVNRCATKAQSSMAMPCKSHATPHTAAAPFLQSL